jgi:hypothetical protein
MSKEMYALVDGTPFKPGQKPKSDSPEFPKIYKADGITQIPYTHKQTISINQKFDRDQNYYILSIKIYCVYDTLHGHIGNAFKVAPPTLPPFIGWNSTMTFNNIFDQITVTYGKLTPNAMHQNNLNFLAPHNPQDPPKLLFKR